MTDDLVGRLDKLATHLEALGDDGASTVSEAAARIEALEGALQMAHDLLMCIEQTTSNVWWVNAEDPEMAVSDTFSAIEAALTPEPPHAD